LAVAGTLAFALTLEQVVSLINFGALTGFLAVHAAAMREGLARHPARTAGVWVRHVLVPLAGAGFLATLLWSLSPMALAVGGTWLAIGVGVLTYRGRS
jgi:hypothetical protein